MFGDVYRIPTNSLIVLCKLGRSYDSFSNDLKKFIELPKILRNNIIENIYNDAITGTYSLFSIRYKHFLKKQRDVIDLMKKYKCLDSFTTLEYYSSGERKNKYDFDFFFDYIKRNEDKVDKIEAVAQKISSLGIDMIEFNRNIDFTKYQFCLNSGENTAFEFLDNIEVYPTYSSDYIKYKTTDSCFCISLYLLNSANSWLKSTIDDDKIITLNDLCFDVNKLPNEITVETTVYKIVDAWWKKENAQRELINYIDYDIQVYGLKKTLNAIKSLLVKIGKNNIDNKNGDLISLMQELLSGLDSYEKSYKKQILDTYSCLDESLIESEKQERLIKKYYNV